MTNTTAELVAETRRLEGDYGDTAEVINHLTEVTDALVASEAKNTSERAAGWDAAMLYLAELDSWQMGSRKYPRPLPSQYLNKG